MLKNCLRIVTGYFFNLSSRLWSHYEFELVKMRSKALCPVLLHVPTYVGVQTMPIPNMWSQCSLTFKHPPGSTLNTHCHPLLFDIHLVKHIFEILPGILVAYEYIIKHLNISDTGSMGRISRTQNTSQRTNCWRTNWALLSTNYILWKNLNDNTILICKYICKTKAIKSY